MTGMSPKDSGFGTELPPKIGSLLQTILLARFLISVCCFIYAPGIYGEEFSGLIWDLHANCINPVRLGGGGGGGFRHFCVSLLIIVLLRTPHLRNFVTINI